MPGIVLDRAEDRPYGPGNPDYEYDKWRDDMDETMSEAERELQEWWVNNGAHATPEKIWLAADARATERAARRCVEICRIHWDEEAIVRAIAKEFGL